MEKDPLSGKKIILGITGCIAAYKSSFIIRELVKRKAEVKVIMTPAATEFITPLTLATLSKNEVVVNTFPESQKNGAKLTTWHVDLGTWADLMLIAPATINTVAKLAHGFADNALTTLVPAIRCPLIVSPAADVDMYEHPLTKENIKKLEELGYFVIPAEEGELASGLKGSGRLPEIDKIIDTVEIVLSGYKKDLTGKNILVTAGPTYEDIDPVRFIGNRSSGKMGFEIARAAFLRGANVILITGPTNEIAYREINLIKIRSAEELKNTVHKELKKNDILIMAAAVADYRPTKASNKKIKKEERIEEIKLTETADILSSLKAEGKMIIGFALETDDELKNAEKKLKKKNLDMIILNSLKDKKSGFEFDTNKITIINKDGKKKEFDLMSKFQAANKILFEAGIY